LRACRPEPHFIFGAIAADLAPDFPCLQGAIETIRRCFASLRLSGSNNQGLCVAVYSGFARDMARARQRIGAECRPISAVLSSLCHKYLKCHIQLQVFGFATRPRL
jgi:hypothetical protein